jgi:modulator of FtsH protease HflK
VVRAREDRERQQNEAQAYMEDILPKARGESEQVTRSADAYRQQRVLQAQGDVARFRAVLEEYAKGKEVTRERLYLETIERVLSKIGKVVVDSSVGDRTLPVLPINELTRGVTAQPTAQPQTQPTQPSTPPSVQPQSAPGTQPQPAAKPTAVPGR